MTVDEVRDALKSVVPTIDWAQVADDQDLEQAGLDSLDKAGVILDLETRLSTTISDDDYADLNTIAELSKLA
jgi:acyl carrier protein